jgi:hypothetical protein
MKMADATATATVTAPVAPAPAAPVKPGWKTSEFWGKRLAEFLSALYLTNVIPTDGWIPKVCAVAALELGSWGYTVARTKAKAAS